MKQPAMTKLGSIRVAEVEALSSYAGRDFLPFPLSLPGPSPEVYEHGYDAYVSSVVERYRYGDLQLFTKWAKAYESADLRVECRAFYSDGTPPTRIVAHRQGQLGFFSHQRPNDTVDVFTLSPFLLGPAVAIALKLTKPGTHPAIRVPANLVPRIWDAGFGLGDLAFPRNDVLSLHEDVVAQTPVKEFSHPELAASATIQSHWQGTRRWGFDHGKNAVVWVSVNDCGDYICTQRANFAEPMTREALSRRVDELIAEDVLALREFRSDK